MDKRNATGTLSRRQAQIDQMSPQAIARISAHRSHRAGLELNVEGAAVGQAIVGERARDVAAVGRAVTEPKMKSIAGVVVEFLPSFGGVQGYQALTDATQVTPARLQGYPGGKILVLHADIGGCVMDASGRLGRGPSPEKLGFDQYDAVFSGHIQRHQ